MNGVSTYAFLVLARRDLGEVQYGSLAVLWGLVFVLGAGLFQPVEQELSRTLSQRASAGIGGSGVLRQVGKVCTIAALGVSLGLLVAWPLGLSSLLADDAWLGVGLALALASYGAAQLVRGTLAAGHRFGALGLYLAAEGGVRLGLAIALVVVGFATTPIFAVALAVSFAGAALFSYARERPLTAPGPVEPWNILMPSLGLLLAASLGEAFLLNIGPVAVDILSDEPEAPGRFLNSLIVARLPVVAFQAVKVVLLPKLASLSGPEDRASFVRIVLGILAVIAIVMALGVVILAIIGPVIVSTLFGDEVGAIELAVLTTSSGTMLLNLTLVAALLARRRNRDAALGWLVGAVAFVPMLFLGASDAFMRVAVALVASSLVTFVFIALALWRSLNSPVRSSM